MVQSPVGYLCRDCAHMKKLPQYQLTSSLYARVIPGALVLALGVGFLLSYVPYLGWIGGLVVGVVVAAALKRLSGYKQGREMEIIAGVTVALAVVAGSAFTIARALGPGHAGAAIHDALQPQMLGLNALGIIVGVYIAVQQLR
jgi:hypothetical protein